MSYLDITTGRWYCLNLYGTEDLYHVVLKLGNEALIYEIGNKPISWMSIAEVKKAFIRDATPEELQMIQAFDFVRECSL